MNKPLVLVVEDDRPVRNLIVTTLKAHDYRYLTAENGHSAIIEATSHNPDIVLLDLGLPDIDGTQVIESIRSWSNMPIIVISARSEERLSDKAFFHRGAFGTPSGHAKTAAAASGKRRRRLTRFPKRQA